MANLIKLKYFVFITIILLFYCAANDNCYADSKAYNHSPLELMVKLQTDCKEVRIQDSYLTSLDAASIIDIVNISQNSFTAKISSYGTEETIDANFECYINLPISVKILHIGKILSQADVISTAVLKQEAKTKNYIISEDDLIGKQLRVKIPSHVAFKKEYLINPMVLKRGDPVTLLYEKNGISIKSSGICLKKAAVGDSVRVKNSKTGIELDGVVLDNSTIKIYGK